MNNKQVVMKHQYLVIPESDNNDSFNLNTIYGLSNEIIINFQDDNCLTVY